MKTKARFLSLQGKQVYDLDNKPKEGDYLNDEGTIFRFKSGFLHSDKLPAIECNDTHREYWNNGKIHREEGPAVVSEYGEWEEYWTNGELQKIEQEEEQLRGVC
jgi:hypothetical protein